MSQRLPWVVRRSRPWTGAHRIEELSRARDSLDDLIAANRRHHPTPAVAR
ncbi:hypothetical protein [Micromonospora sp. HUAS LYJ1]|nr:hypothetical protein [Micromonospora sp. HUAS LYJ1]WKU06875.1 hypothetical protein Q2K16_07450 [Micromonospora sp. HUAS LYJ1]